MLHKHFKLFLTVLVIFFTFLFYYGQKTFIASAEDLLKSVPPANYAYKDIDKIGASLDGIKVEDKGVEAKVMFQTGLIKSMDAQKTLSSKLFQSTLSMVLNTLAFDAANWLASGGKGQSAGFERRTIGQLATDALNAGAGEFLYQWGTQGPLGVNLCEPNLGVKMKIGLGLVQYQRPNPKCTFSEMRQNWEAELRNPDFSTRFQDYFDPTSNDVGISLSVHSMNLERLARSERDAVEERKTHTGGIKPISEMISGLKTTPSILVYDAQKKAIVENLGDNIGKYTGDALIDALNIFINQLAIQLINNLLRGGLFSSDHGGGLAQYLYNPQADSGAGGARAAQDRFRKIIQPRFNIRGDYSILSELTTCPDPNNAGPTNCVITDKFRQAIQDKKTVGQSMREGLLNPEGIFGFEAKNVEPRIVDENYPYRSMLILRKFRILPVGWEVAANYINENLRQTTLKEMINCFASDDDYGQASNTKNWCRGLVDPNWVLKAPLNYCAREGYGPELIGEPQVANDNYIIQRKNNYCADEQACIKENADGSCDVYGYCTAERRTWNFGTNNCEPLFNTCQTFTATNGSTVSYLQNTLDWCSSNGAGCKAYATDYNYATQKWTGSSNIYLNKNAESCNASDEGCHEFIRVKPGLETNLLPNASFEQGDGGVVDYWKGNAGISKVSTESVYGSYSVLISSSTGWFTYPSNSSNSEFILRAGSKYILSGYVKNINATEVYLQIDEFKTNIVKDKNSNWERIYIAFTLPSDITPFTVSIFAKGGWAYIDALQLEEVTTANQPSVFKDYRENNVVYEKKMPEDAQTFCEENEENVNDKTDATQKNINICASLDQKFARSCSAKEVGCELFTRVRDDFRVPARVKAADYCPQECDGYDTHIQQASIFQPFNTQAYFIPNSAKTCSAQAVGCEEFTNLDEVKQGGEGIEYYSTLRQCTSISADSQPFYTWEGSGETGFQLKVFTLKDYDNNSLPDINFGSIDGDNNHINPINLMGIDLCNEGIFNAAVTDGNYNPNCRQFYARDGKISYILDTYVVYYSTNCHPYRLSADYDQNACEQSGGVYNDNKECVYMAIPQQGVQCSAANNSCRAYTGNVGNNTRVVFADDFEDGSLANWQDKNDLNINVNTAYKQDDASLQVDTNYIYKNLTGLVPTGNIKNKSFELEMLVKGKEDNVLKVFLQKGASQDKKEFGQIILNDNWQSAILNLQLDTYEMDNTVRLVLVIEGTKSVFYIDTIILRERADIYYLIRDSWRTPNSCIKEGDPFNTYTINSTDNIGNIIQGKYVGCYEYSDRDSQSHYLYKFSSLCAEKDAGCELMIDTNNYTPFQGQPNSSLAPGNEILTDKFVYMVYDPSKLCVQSAKSCQALGLKNNNNNNYTTKYLKNDPDKYNTILCGVDDVDCEEYQSTDGSLAYFKNPGNNVCEYRDGYSGYNWYEKQIKYCDSDGSNTINHNSNRRIESTQCTNNGDCNSGVNCIVDTWDVLCATDENSAPKTVGIGGAGNSIKQPQNTAGVCPAYASGCTEIIDPISNPSVNMIFNNDFSQDVDDNTADGWNDKQQALKDLQANTLYVLSVKGDNKASVYCNTNKPRTLDKNNQFLESPVKVDNDAQNSRVFYLSGSPDDCFVKVDNSNTNNGSSVYLREAIVNYNLKTDLDYQSCNGQTNDLEGCVLFNMRTVNGSAYDKLIYNANNATTSNNSQNLPTCSNDDCNSNKVLKVAGDRVCDEWLACRSSAVILNDSGQEERTCYDIGVCDGLNNANNQCKSWVQKDPVNQNISINNISTKQSVANVTGYSKVGFLQNINTQGYYHLGAMDQTGDLAIIPNGGFEYVTGANVPVSWVLQNAAGQQILDAKNFVSTVNSPQAAQKYDIYYPIEGRQFLALGAAYKLESQVDIEVAPQTDYTMTAYINTLSLNSGSAQIRVNDTNSNVTINQKAGKNWEKKFIKFNSGSANRVKIVIAAANSARGTFFVDDIQMRPSLAVKDLDNNNNNKVFYQSQDCRLYSTADALSCSYVDNSGINQKGWYGYCLEYDRAPVGNPEACLLWWPVDRVKGDGVDEQVPSYIGRAPLYQCVEVQDNRYVAIPEEFANLSMPARIGCDSPSDNGYFVIFKYKLLVDDEIRELPEVRGKFVPGVDPEIPGYGLVGGTPNNVELHITENPVFSINGINYYDFTKVAWITYAKTDCDFIAGKTVKNNDFILDTNTVPICKKLVQTVDILGQNKAWSSRIQEGNDYAMGCYDAVNEALSQDCLFAADTAPFGSMSVPTPVEDPTQWSSKNSIIKIPILAELPDKSMSSPYQVRFRYATPYGQINNPDGLISIPTKNDMEETSDNNIATTESKQGSTIMGVFAKSYGSWHWDWGVGEGGECVNTNKFCDNSYQTKCTNNNNKCDLSSNVCAVSNNYTCEGGVFNGKTCVPNTNSIDCQLADDLAKYCFNSDPEQTSGVCNTNSNNPDKACKINDLEDILNTCFSFVSKSSYEGTCKLQSTTQQCALTKEYCTIFDDQTDTCNKTTGECTIGICANNESKKCLSDAQCSTNGRYVPDDTITWDVPRKICGENESHAVNSSDYCAILPKVINIKVNNKDSNNVILSPQDAQVHLTFNSNVDDDQLPLVELRIDWGDGETTSITGMEMRERVNMENPHSFYHIYSYWDLLKKDSGSDSISCNNSLYGNHCEITPKIWLRDNWGWYSQGTIKDTPPITPDAFYGSIVVKE